MSAHSRAPRRPFAGRRVVLGVTGGIAAYKSAQLARDLTLAGAEVDVVLSKGALHFIQPLTFESLTGRPVSTVLHLGGDPLLHIRLAREAHLVVVAPATADFLARAAAGMADDLLTALLLATGAPVLLCPAMNDRMYAHPQTQANLASLLSNGCLVAGPATGPLAWGEGEGPGRMLEPREILAHCGRALDDRPLEGRRLLVTAGPTREPIDPVRFIGNRSSGRMGYALAASAWRRGAEVCLVTGPTSIDPPEGVEVVWVETAEEMREAVASRLPLSDSLVMAAAVADFRPAGPATEKVKKGGGSVPELPIEATLDILQSTRELRPRGCVVVGFALETEAAVANGRAKLQDKELDLLVVNDAREPGAGFEVDTNRVTILHRDGTAAELPLLSKDEVADEILDRLELLLPAAASQ